MQVIFTALSEHHIDQLHAYISEQVNEDRADAYVRHIVDFCKGLTIFPLRGIQRDDLLPGLRIVGFRAPCHDRFCRHDGHRINRRNILRRPGSRSEITWPPLMTFS